MADSTLDITGEESPTTRLGHGTGALGPSDSSDSGSDVVGGPGMDEGLSDEQAREMPQTTRSNAGRDLGDSDLDSDSDRAGTGERAGSGVQDGGANDQALSIEPGVESGENDFDDFDDPDAASRKARDDLDDVPVSDGAT